MQLLEYGFARTSVIKDIKNRGGSVAAVLPIHYPRALLRAFDIYPIEVWGPPKWEVMLRLFPAKKQLPEIRYSTPARRWTTLSSFRYPRL